MKNTETTDGAGRYAYDGLDRVIHEKARLGILTSLVTHRKGLSFNELKTLCALTDGNLNRHLQPLQEAGLIRYRRGHITVLDRPGLEARSCECYQVVKTEFDRLLPYVAK